uniref:hypothetical protein n=1 Tax=Streptomyces sp. NBC_01592 TaxID=2975889 RepID=UPI002F90C168
MLPDAWQDVDDYYYFPRFASLRVPPGTTPVRPRGLLAAHLDHVERTITAGGCTSFVFHVSRTDTPQRAEVIDELLDRLTDDPRVWCASPRRRGLLRRLSGRPPPRRTAGLVTDPVPSTMCRGRR